MRTSTMLAALLLVPVILAPAHAMIVIDVGSTNLLPDGTGTVDVLISGDGEALAVFNLLLRITPATGTTSTLEFVDPQTNEYYFDSDYIFSGNPDEPSRTVSALGQELYIGDYTADFSDVTVTTSRLLARLEIDHEFPVGVDPATTLGDTFTIEVDPDPGFTLFLDSSYNTYSYTSNSGTVTIVPEPTSLTVWGCLGLLGLTLLHRSRRRPLRAT